LASVAGASCALAPGGASISQAAESATAQGRQLAGMTLIIRVRSKSLA
jgi:hypothetical protein